MALISLSEYAKKHNVTRGAIQQKIKRGYIKTAVKVGFFYVIDEDEPYTDMRVTSGKTMKRNIQK